MVDKKRGRNKSEFLGILSILIIISFIGLVLGLTATLNNPIVYGNYSGTNLTINCTTDIADNIASFNVTFSYNATNGSAAEEGTNITTIVNTSEDQTVFEYTIDTTTLADGAYYNFSCYANNGSFEVISGGIENVTIDNTAPNVSHFFDAVEGGSYNDTLNLQVTVDDALLGIDTVIFNLTNASYQQEAWINATTIAGVNFSTTYNVANLSGGLYYLFVHANDSATNSNTSNTNSSESISIIIDQDMAPRVTNFTNTVNLQNFSAANLSTGENYTLNVSVVDTGVAEVWFNITYPNGTQTGFGNTTVNWTKSTGNHSSYYYSTMNISVFADGLYNVTVFANDSNGSNLNSSEHIQFRVDTSNPTITASRSAYTRTSLTLAVSPSDDSSIRSCTSSRAGATVTGSGTSFTVTETGLSCSTGYIYTITCMDNLYQNGSIVTASFSTDACAGGSSGGSGTTSTWTHTYSINDEQFKAGYNKEIGVKERMTIKVGTKTHTVGVLSLTATSANIEVSSDPVMLTLAVGGEAKLDLTDDGFYDLLVKLVGIANNKADVSVQEIHQEVPEGGESVSSTGDVTPIDSGETTTTEDEEEKSLTWLWILVLGVILVAVVAWFVLNKQKK